MKVHVSVDVRYGTEVFLAVEAAKCSSTVGQNDRTTSVFSLDWSPNHVQPKTHREYAVLHVRDQHIFSHTSDKWQYIYLFYFIYLFAQTW